MKKTINELVEKVLSTATEMASSYNHAYINSGHLLLAILKNVNNLSNTKQFLIRTSDRLRTTVTLFNADKIKQEDIEQLTIRDDKYYLYDADTHITSDKEIIDFKQISEGKNDKVYSAFADDILRLFDKYAITPHVLKYAFLIRNPKEKEGNNYTLNDKGEKEYNFTEQSDNIDIYTNISAIAREVGRQQDIFDLVKILMSNDAYEAGAIFNELQDIANSNKEYEFIKPINFNAIQFRNEAIEICNKYIPEFNGTVTKVNKFNDLEENKFLTNINDFVAKKPRLYYGLDEVLSNIEVQLCTETSRNIALVGPSGVGKNEIVYALADKINKGECPDFLKKSVIYELNISAMVAGSHYRGDFEQRATATIESLKKHPEAILFIDKGEMISSAGSGGGNDKGDSSLGNMLETYLSRNEITVITSMASSDYKLLEKNKTLSGRFNRITVIEPSDEDTKKILNNIIPHKEEYYGIKADDNLIQSIIDLGPKYDPASANPRRSINLLDSAFAYAKKNEHETAGALDVKMYLAKKHGFIFSDHKADDTYAELKKKILGQDKAIDRIYENLQICELGIVDDKSPLYTMAFFGPTGTGKSETAKLIAKYYFGSEKRCVIISASQLSGKESGSNLIGSSRGFVGYGEDTPLTKVKENPNCVILFDEIEKASDEVRQLLLSGLNEGYIEDSRGDIIPLRNAIIIFTSNIGFSFDTMSAKGAGLIKEPTGTMNVRKELQEKFTPEFLGRINDTITFNYLSDDVIKELIAKITEDFKKCSHITEEITYTEDDYKEIAKLAKIKESGARLLTQVVRRIIAKKILAIRQSNEQLVKEEA